METWIKSSCGWMLEYQYYKRWTPFHARTFFKMHASPSKKDNGAKERREPTLLTGIDCKLFIAITVLFYLYEYSWIGSKNVSHGPDLYNISIKWPLHSSPGHTLHVYCEKRTGKDNWYLKSSLPFLPFVVKKSIPHNGERYIHSK